MISKSKFLAATLLTAGFIGLILPQAQLTEVMAAQSGVVIVQKGDNLSKIAAKYGVTVQKLQLVNKLSGTLIRIGQTLIIPDTLVYIVKPGDNLSRIAYKYGVSIEALKKVNNLGSSTIYPAGELIIPKGNVYRVSTMEKSFKSRLETRIKPIIAQGELSSYRGENSSLEISTGNSMLEGFDGKSIEPSSLNRSLTSNSNQKSNLKLDKEEIYLLAKLIHAEARGESMKGKIAVGAVILNRLKSPDFPKTINEVIFQKNSRVYQFSPVEDGSIKLEPNEAAWRAAVAAATGEDPTNGALFFYNPEIATDEWIKTLPVATVIGNHVFAR